MKIIFIYITNPDTKTARRVAELLLKKRLAACANIFPIQSLYRWKNKIAKEKEVVLIMKTRQSLFKKVEQEVKRIHPYTIPCITKISVQPNHSYREWLLKETSA